MTGGRGWIRIWVWGSTGERESGGSRSLKSNLLTGVFTLSLKYIFTWKCWVFPYYFKLFLAQKLNFQNIQGHIWYTGSLQDYSWILHTELFNRQREHASSTKQFSFLCTARIKVTIYYTCYTFLLNKCSPLSHINPIQADFWNLPKIVRGQARIPDFSQGGGQDFFSPLELFCSKSQLTP